MYLIVLVMNVYASMLKLVDGVYSISSYYQITIW